MKKRAIITTAMATAICLMSVMPTLEAQAATYTTPPVSLHYLNATTAEITPKTPSSAWSSKMYVPDHYGVETEVTLQGGFFPANVVGKTARIVYYHNAKKEVLLTDFVNPTEELIQVVTPSLNGQMYVVFDSTEPHVIMHTQYKLSIPYAVNVINYALAKWPTEFVYPARVDVFAIHPLVSEIYQKITHETPYAGYVLSISDSEINGNTVFKFKYRETPSQLKTVKKVVQEILDRIIKPGMDVYEKELTIHNWIASHIRYDNSKNGANDSDYTALTLGKADCAGITDLTYQMLTAAGIKNRMVGGFVHGATYSQDGKTITKIVPGGNEPHIWNEVDLNGRWYMVDVTGDLSDANSGKIGYTFFNLASSQLAHTHTWNRSGLPVANTDFVSVLQHSKKPQDKQILHAKEG